MIIVTDERCRDEYLAELYCMYESGNTISPLPSKFDFVVTRNIEDHVSVSIATLIF